MTTAEVGRNEHCAYEHYHGKYQVFQRSVALLGTPNTLAALIRRAELVTQRKDEHPDASSTNHVPSSRIHKPRHQLELSILRAPS